MCVARSRSSRQRWVRKVGFCFDRVSRNLGSKLRSRPRLLPLSLSLCADCRGLPPPPMSSINARYPSSDGRNVEEGKRGELDPPLSPISERFPSSIHFSPLPLSINASELTLLVSRRPRPRPSHRCSVPACVVCCGDRILVRDIHLICPMAQSLLSLFLLFSLSPQRSTQSV